MSSRTNKLAHEMLAETAKEMAGAWYEEAAHDNEFYAFYPKQKFFINREWHRFIPAAKTQLAVMLGMSDEQVPEWQKERIADALIKHASLPGNVDPRVAARVAPIISGLERVH
jgi:hypothetical protein